jgi:hypothetical protein
MDRTQEIINSLQQNGVLPAKVQEREGRVLVSLFSTSSIFRKEQPKPPEQFQVLANNIFSGVYKSIGTQGENIQLEGVDMFRFMNSGITFSSYQNTTSAQKVVQDFFKFKTNVESNKAFITWDIETMGDTKSPGKFFIPEIAMIKSEVMKDGTLSYGRGKNNVFSVLMAPNANMQDILNNKINDFISNPSGFKGMGGSFSRTLVDLMRYSSATKDAQGNVIKNADFSKIGTEGVTHSEIISKVLKGNKIDEREIINNAEYYAGLMREGLKNLVTHGEGSGVDGKRDYNTLIKDLNSVIKNNSNLFFLTKNGTTFDMPTIMSWAKDLNDKGTATEVLQMAGNNFDMEEILNVITKNPYALHEGMLGEVREKGTVFEEGTSGLQELKKTLGIEVKGSAHSGFADSKVTAEIQNKLFGVVTEHLERARERGAKASKSVGVKSINVAYDETPATYGSVWFAKNAVQNRSAKHLNAGLTESKDPSVKKFFDFQVEFDEEGKPVVRTGGFNMTNVNAETFYRVNRTIDMSDATTGVKRYGLELFDETNNIYSYVIREGENAHYEIFDFMQRNFVNQENVNKNQRKKIERINLEDKARRRYDSLFSLQETRTKGLDGAERMFKNAMKFRDSLAQRRVQWDTEIFDKLNEINERRKNEPILGLMNATEEKTYIESINEKRKNKYLPEMTSEESKKSFIERRLEKERKKKQAPLSRDSKRFQGKVQKINADRAERKRELTAEEAQREIENERQKRKSLFESDFTDLEKEQMRIEINESRKGKTLKNMAGKTLKRFEENFKAANPNATAQELKNAIDNENEKRRKTLIGSVSDQKFTDILKQRREKRQKDNMPMTAQEEEDFIKNINERRAKRSGDMTEAEQDDLLKKVNERRAGSEVSFTEEEIDKMINEENERRRRTPQGPVSEEEAKRLIKAKNDARLKTRRKPLTPEKEAEIKSGMLRKKMKDFYASASDTIGLDFDSMWDPINESFVKNKTEEKHFFAMADRLIEEAPDYLNAIDEIKKSFTGYDTDTREKMQRMAFYNFHQKMIQAKGGDKESRGALPFEKRGFYFTDIESKDNKKIFVDMYSYEKTIGKLRSYVNADRPKNKDGKDRWDDKKVAQHKNEKLRNLLVSLQESGIISKKQVSDYVEDLVYERQTIETILNRVSDQLMRRNDLVIKDVEQTKITALGKSVGNISEIIAESITETEGSLGGIVKTAGGSWGFSPKFQEILRQSDNVGEIKIGGITVVNPNNTGAVTEMFSQIRKTFEGKYDDFGIQMNNIGSEVIFSVYKSEDSASEIQKMISGEKPGHNKRIEISMPILTKEGTIMYGQRVLNNKSFFHLDSSGKLIQLSAVEQITKEFMESGVLERAKRLYNMGDYETATRILNSQMSETIDRFGGVLKTTRYGKDWKNTDTLARQGNMSDLIKQGNVNIESAYIQDLFENVNARENILERRDFHESAFIKGDRTQGLRSFVGLDDLKTEARERIIYGMNDWLKQKNLSLYLSGVKSTQAGAVLSKIDLRDYYVYGHAISMDKDNAVQRLSQWDLKESTKRFFDSHDDFSTDSYIKTRMQREAIGMGYQQNEVYTKVAMMSQKDVDTRIEEMMKNDEDRKILLDEGIIEEYKDKSGNTQYRQSLQGRYLNITEQNIAISKDLQKITDISDRKDFSVGEGFEWNKELYDKEKGEFITREIQPGQVIGEKLVGGKKEKVYWEEKTAGTISTEAGSKYISVEHNETAHKLTIGMEKGTISGGKEKGYGQKFLERITGIKGVQAIMSTNYEKNKFFGMQAEGYVNIALEKIKNEKDAGKRDKLFGILQKHASNLDLVIGAEDSRRGINATNFLVDNVDSGRDAEDYVKSSKQMLDEMGISIKSEVEINGRKFETDYGIHGVAANRVRLYSKTINESGQKFLGTDAEGKPIYSGSTNNGVNLGHREMKMLREKGMTHIADILDQRSIAELGREGLIEQYGILQANAVIAGDLDTAFPDHMSRTMSVHDFAADPPEKLNIATITGTVLDEDHIRRHLGMNSLESGYFLQIPKTKVNGVETPITMGGKNVDKVFVPFMRMEGKGNELWKKDMHAVTQKIFKAAKQVEENGGNDAVQKLQEAVNDYRKVINRHSVSSKGSIVDSIGVTKGSASYGSLKVMPDKLSQFFDDNSVLISEEDAKASLTGEEVDGRKITLFDKIMGTDQAGMTELEREKIIAEKRADVTKQNAYYGIANRPPTFTEDAVQSVRYYVGSNVAQGEMHVTRKLAMQIKGDSDGDYLKLFNFFSNKEQTDLQEAHLREKIDFESGEKPKYRDFMQDYIDDINKEGERKFDHRVVDEGAERLAVNRQAEFSAKTGKGLVGSASNLNFTMRHLGEQFASGDENANRALRALGEGLEQKLTISSKHVSSIKGEAKLVIDIKAGAEELLSAIKSGNFNEARNIDNQNFGGMFQKKYQLNEAAQSLSNIFTNLQNQTGATTITLGNVSDIFHELKYGTSTPIQPDANNVDVEQRFSDLTSINEETTNETVRRARLVKESYEQMHAEESARISTSGSAQTIPSVISHNSSVSTSTAASASTATTSPYASPTTGSSSIPVTGTTSTATGRSSTAGSASTSAAGPAPRQATPSASMATSIKNIMKKNKTGFMIGGAILGAGSAYAMLNDNSPISPPSSVAPVMADYSNSNGDMFGQVNSPSMSISAKGSGLSQEKISMYVSEALKSSNIQNQSMNVNYTNNATKLNKPFVRDTISGYI